MELKLLFLISLSIFPVKSEFYNNNIGCSYKLHIITLDNNLKHHYGCLLTYTSDEDNDELFGGHFPGKTDDDVQFVASKVIKSPLPKIFSLKICEKFKNLKKILISRKDVEEIEANTLDDCLNLTDFTFIDNKLREIPENLFIKNSKLEILNLWNNQIQFIPADSFKSLKKLEHLSLSRNNLKSLNPEWFKNLENLKQFSADGNEILELPKDIFKPLKNLIGLHLYNNSLTVIHSDSFSLPSKLQELSLNQNKIKAIDRKLLDDSNISKVSMHPNVCSNSNMEFREETLMGLKRCFDNYQPRDE